MWLFAPPAVAKPRLERFYTHGAEFPAHVTRGPDGAVWFTTTGGLGRVATDGTVTLHRTPGMDPAGLAAGPDGALWFTTTDPGRVVRMSLDGEMTVFSGGVSPNGPIAAGPDGALWFAAGAPDRLARITTDGQLTEFPPLPKDAGALALTGGPDGNIWFSWESGIGRVTPRGAVRVWKLGGDGVPDDGSIALGPDGNLWLAGLEFGDLIRFTPRGVATRIRAGDQPFQVTAGPDGNLWFTYYFGVGRVAPDGSRRTLFREPFGSQSDCDSNSGLGPADGLAFNARGTLWAADGISSSLERIAFRAAAPSPLEGFLPRGGALRAPNAMAAGRHGDIWISGPHVIVRVTAKGRRTAFRRGVGRRPGALLAVRGGAVWFASDRGIARLSRSGRVRPFAHGFGRRSRVTALALGPRGSVWFVDAGRHAVGRLEHGRAHEYTRGLGRRPNPLTIAPGPDGRMWFTDQAGSIDRITGSGRVRRFSAGLGPKPSPTSIVAGPDGNLWFTQFDTRRIGRITPAGRVTQWQVKDLPSSIAVGPDGAMWFTTATRDDADTRAGVGRITVQGSLAEFYARTTCDASYHGLISGPDHKLWFLEAHGPIAVARMDPQRLVELGELPG